MHSHLSLVEFPPRKLLGALAAASLLQMHENISWSNIWCKFFLKYYLSVGIHNFKQI